MSLIPVPVIVPDNKPATEQATAERPPVGGNLRELVAGVLRVHPDTLLPRQED